MCRYSSIVIALALVPACFSPNQVDPIAETEGGEATAATSETTATAGETESGPGSTGSFSGEGTTSLSTTGPSGTGDGDGETSETSTDEETGSGGAECEGPLVTCGTHECAIDLMVDPLNCGECGHDCLGGECDARECQPVSLFVEGDLRDLAADEDYVYFITAGTVERIPQQVMADAEILADDGPKPGPGKREIEATPEGIVLMGGLLPDGFVRLIGLDGAAAQDLAFDAIYNTPAELTSTSKSRILGRAKRRTPRYLRHPWNHARWRQRPNVCSRP